MVLNFKKVIFFAEDFNIFLRGTFRTVNITLQYFYRNFTGNAGAQADKPFTVFAQNVFINARFIIFIKL